MESIGIWITIATVIVFPFLGWIFNTLITRKIDDLKEQHVDFKKDIESLKSTMTTGAEKNFGVVWKRYDDLEKYSNETFLKEKEYKIHMEYQEKQMDQKFVSLLSTTNTLIQGLETKVDISAKNTSEKIEDIKEMIRNLDGKKRRIA